MKKISGVTAILLAILVTITGCNSKTTISYDISSYHFVKNIYKGETNPSYLLIRSYSSFDSLFGIAMVMNADTSKLITQEKMKDKFVFSIIYQGNDIYKFAVEKISLKDNQLQVYYTSEVTQRNASYSANSHVTLLVQNCDFGSVLLFENGKPLNDAKIKEYD